MGSLLLVRHGQASFGAEDYDRLSPLGHQQAQWTADELDRRAVVASAVRHGSLRRQTETAAPIPGSADTLVDARWNEYDSDDLMAAHSASAVRLHGSPHVSSRDFQVILEDALHGWVSAGETSDARETWPRFRARVQDALSDAAGALGSGETGIVVTSAGVIAAVCALLTGGEAEAFVRFNRTGINAGITKIATGRSGLSLISFNEHAHLEVHGREVVTYR
ncbi:MAG: histidine phosphatase family protein [Patulibacter sp.]|nr:histidine phosphatase family protein [Patulibacter sp.]